MLTTLDAENNTLEIQAGKLTFCTQSHEGLVQMIFLFKQVIFRFKWLVPCAKLPAPAVSSSPLPGDPRSREVPIRNVKTGDASEIMHQLIWYPPV